MKNNSRREAQSWLCCKLHVRQSCCWHERQRIFLLSWQQCPCIIKDKWSSIPLKAQAPKDTWLKQEKAILSNDELPPKHKITISRPLASAYKLVSARAGWNPKVRTDHRVSMKRRAELILLGWGNPRKWKGSFKLSSVLSPSSKITQTVSSWMRSVCPLQSLLCLSNPVSPCLWPVSVPVDPRWDR